MGNAVLVIAGVLAVVGTIWLVISLIPRSDGSLPARVTAAPLASASGPPRPQTLARVVGDRGESDLALQVPINQRVVKVVGYESIGDPGALAFAPEGRRANGSLVERLARRFLATAQPASLRYVIMGSGEKQNSIHVGAPPEAEVYAPISGTVLAIADNRINGASAGVVVHLQPLGDPETVVLIRNLDAAQELAVGQTVAAGATRIGSVRAPEPSQREPLAKYTHDDGPNVQLIVHRLQGAPSF